MWSTGEGNGKPLQYSCLENPMNSMKCQKDMTLHHWLSQKFLFSHSVMSNPTLCNPMYCSTPGFPVLHYLLEFPQTRVHQVSDAIQPSHPLLSPSPLAFKESVLHIRWPKYWSFSFISALPMNIQDWFPLGWTGWNSLQSKGPSRVFSNTTVQKHQFFGTQLSSQSNSHIHTCHWKNHSLD